jgi:hypothetical protein
MPQPFDLVIADGRVMDPESGLDGMRHVAVDDPHDRILGRRNGRTYHRVDSTTCRTVRSMEFESLWAWDHVPDAPPITDVFATDKSVEMTLAETLLERGSRAHGAILRIDERAGHPRTDSRETRLRGAPDHRRHVRRGQDL